MFSFFVTGKSELSLFSPFKSSRIPTIIVCFCSFFIVFFLSFFFVLSNISVVVTQVRFPALMLKHRMSRWVRRGVVAAPDATKGLWRLFGIGWPSHLIWWLTWQLLWTWCWNFCCRLKWYKVLFWDEQRCITRGGAEETWAVIQVSGAFLWSHPQCPTASDKTFQISIVWSWQRSVPHRFLIHTRSACGSADYCPIKIKTELKQVEQDLDLIRLLYVFCTSGFKDFIIIIAMKRSEILQQLQARAKQWRNKITEKREKMFDFSHEENFPVQKL